jgi:hypothetical protein
MCVKTCPSNDSSEAVECVMPTTYFSESDHFKNC